MDGVRLGLGTQDVRVYFGLLNGNDIKLWQDRPVLLIRNLLSSIVAKPSGAAAKRVIQPSLSKRHQF